MSHQEGLDALSPEQVEQNCWSTTIEAKRSFPNVLRSFASIWPTGCRLKSAAVALRCPCKLLREHLLPECIGLRQIGPEQE
ncbi:MAG: hypothetical protein ACI9SE_003831, partial [Neolewinella sp.]